ncbi:hypothetical protein [Streptomyces sp. ST2-7A]|uniref:hypothetical protein n=1 Tax=Streptomyces sp. ST2-7A TaxID=2907214 RepID=UPI001F2432FC|nr:hypothetical protein [Streptomyces sp. ST2-7A]MCE7080313.1 hypothetical protein [Streptomyces sp. ST2-7A]
MSRLENSLSKGPWFEEHVGLGQSEEMQDLRIEVDFLEAALTGFLGADEPHEIRHAEEVVDEGFRLVEEGLSKLSDEDVYSRLREYISSLKVAYGELIKERKGTDF